jgi:transcriptional regulator with XRE-family HTH domain
MNNKKPREERLSLKESRNMAFEKFRRNIRILRASLDISAVEMAKKMKLKNGKRYVDMEYGRGNPTTEELLIISKWFKVSIDELLFKEAKITFE